jgi:uncharacterized protein YdeI (YjbR/CyaY-like superfamily)
LDKFASHEENMAKAEKQVHFTNRDDWRSWLAENHGTEKEIWLIHYKKHTGKPTIAYEEAVEEALCFGWIDGVLRRLDEDRYVLRYSPRKNKSIWAESNKERAERMIKQGRMTEAGLAKIREAKKNGEWDKAISTQDGPVIPPDLKETLAGNRKAMKNFDNFAPSRQKQLIWWVTSAKRDETRQRRIEETVSMAERNMKQGKGGDGGTDAS